MNRRPRLPLRARLSQVKAPIWLSIDPARGRGFVHRRVAHTQLGRDLAAAVSHQITNARLGGRNYE